MLLEMAGTEAIVRASSTTAIAFLVGKWQDIHWRSERHWEVEVYSRVIVQESEIPFSLCPRR